MGNLHAMEYASGEHCDFDTGLIAHLQSNHFPPVSIDFVPTCKEAIQVILDGNAEHEITMPNGKTLTADKIIEGLHLDPFVQAAFLAQENPCDNCDQVMGGMDCADCPQYWKNEAEQGGYFVEAGFNTFIEQPKATTAMDAIKAASEQLRIERGADVLKTMTFRVRRAGDPHYLTGDEIAEDEGI